MTDLASTSNNPNEGHSILSEKVARALAVRTDTVAMKAALEALAHLDNGTAASAVDSRSVRTAMEQDALQQAIHLQRALEKIVETVAALRQGCSDVARTAAKVREAIHMPVITAETANTMLFPTTTTTNFEESKSATLKRPLEGGDDEEDAATAEEQKLAAVLSEAFLHRDLARKRLEAVQAFLEKFDLSEQDSAILDQYNFEDVTNLDHSDASPHDTYHEGFAFLNALTRVRKIRHALNQTFGQETHPGIAAEDDSRGLGASSALRMMESLSQKQEGAYERLYHWLQNHLQLFPISDGYISNSSNSNANRQEQQEYYNDEALQHEFVLQALYTLRHVPAFYSHLTELIAACRRSIVTRRFLLALTAGSVDAPPIEMKAHDSVAYVGDMLAFAFKAFSVEADLAKGLLLFHPEHHDASEDENAAAAAVAESSDDMADPSARDDDEDDDDDYGAGKAISAENMLAISMSGLARPLKSRILQVVSTLARRPDEEMESDDGLDDDLEEEGALVRTRVTHLYEICGLLLFYASTTEKGVQKLKTPPRMARDATIGEEPLAPEDDKNPLVECLLECLSEASKAHEATIRVYGAMLDQLAVMTGDSEASLVHQMLVLLADVRMSSPGFSGDVECPTDCQRSLSVEWVTETLVEACLAKCSTLDDAVLLKQSLMASKRAGMGIAAAERLDEEIEKKETELIDELVLTETSQVLDLCGLGGLADVWKRWKDIRASGQSVAMASYPGLSANELEVGMKDFYASLYSPPLPSLETTVKDPVARKLARSKIAEHVCATYSELYQSIASNESGYNDTSFLVHKPEEVTTLFSA